MRKFNKFLALGLAGASLLSGSLMLSGCDVTDDKDKTQTEQEQQKEVASISIKQDSVPSYIIKDHFSRTNVKLNVTYADDTTGVVDVTESMFNETDKAKLSEVGQYNLTINYGGKTATMYANVVDERYLLKEVVEANLDKDFTMTYDDGSIMQVDRENKIVYYDDNDGYKSWVWLNNNICYNYETEDGVNKGLASDFDDCSQDWYAMSVFDILNGVDENGSAWTVVDIEKDGVNYVLTVTQGELCQYKYYFNEDFMYKVEEIDRGGTYIANYNYSILNLNVPSDIKALESSATINVESRIDDLRYGVMESYLESDFEVSVFDNETNTTFIECKYDADNKILIECDTDPNEYELSWVNGDYYYQYYYGDISVYKYNVSNWDRHIMDNCFAFDEVFDANNITVDISEDGQYYELIITIEDDDGEVWEDKYIFNDEEISKIDVKCNNEYMGSYIYNKTNVVLEVPAGIKALEDNFDIFEP